MSVVLGVTAHFGGTTTRSIDVPIPWCSSCRWRRVRLVVVFSALVYIALQVAFVAIVYGVWYTHWRRGAQLLPPGRDLDTFLAMGQWWLVTSGIVCLVACMGFMSSINQSLLHRTLGRIPFLNRRGHAPACDAFAGRGGGAGPVTAGERTVGAYFTLRNKAFANAYRRANGYRER
jgi:hypothetical protein